MRSYLHPKVGGVKKKEKEEVKMKLSILRPTLLFEGTVGKNHNNLDTFGIKLIIFVYIFPCVQIFQNCCSVSFRCIKQCRGEDIITPCQFF